MCCRDFLLIWQKLDGKAVHRVPCTRVKCLCHTSFNQSLTGRISNNSPLSLPSTNQATFTQVQKMHAICDVALHLGRASVDQEGRSEKHLLIRGPG